MLFCSKIIYHRYDIFWNMRQSCGRALNERVCVWRLANGLPLQVLQSGGAKDKSINWRGNKTFRKSAVGAEKASRGVMGNEATSTKLPSNGKIIAACASDAKCAIKMQNGCKSSLSVHPFPLFPFSPWAQSCRNEALKKWCEKILQKILQKYC